MMNVSIFFNKKKLVALNSSTQDYLNRNSAEGFSELSPKIIKAVNNWIIRTKANGSTWSKARVIRIQALGDPTAFNSTKINVKSPTSELSVVSGDVTFGANGYYYGGTNGYTNQKFNPALSEGVTNINLGVMHELMDDFVPNTNALMGIELRTPNRRLGFFPCYSRQNGSVNIICSANDYNFTQGASAPITNTRSVYFGREEATEMKIRVTEPIIKNQATALSPVINAEYYSGGFNYRGVASNFCQGTERLFMAGQCLTDLEITNQVLINSRLFRELGLTETF